MGHARDHTRATLVLVGLAVFLVRSTAFDLNSPNDYDVLSIGSPYTLSWTLSGTQSWDKIAVALLRCRSRSLSTRFCTVANQVSGLSNTGSYLWTFTTAQNDGAFYRFQAADTNRNLVATSGTFTFGRFPVAVDTTWVACASCTPCSVPRVHV